MYVLSSRTVVIYKTRYAVICSDIGRVIRVQNSVNQKATLHCRYLTPDRGVEGQDRELIFLHSCFSNFSPHSLTTSISLAFGLVSEI